MRLSLARVHLCASRVKAWLWHSSAIALGVQGGLPHSDRACAVQRQTGGSCTAQGCSADCVLCSCWPCQQPLVHAPDPCANQPAFLCAGATVPMDAQIATSLSTSGLQPTQVQLILHVFWLALASKTSCCRRRCRLLHISIVLHGPINSAAPRVTCMSQ